MAQRSMVTINKLVIPHARVTRTILYRIMDGVPVEMVIQLDHSMSRSLTMNVEVLGVLEADGEILSIRRVVTFNVRKLYHELHYHTIRIFIREFSF